MKLKWDQTGEHWYELGADHGILFVQNSDGSYKTGVPWNGLTGVTESPGGAEANDMYADDIKYASIRSAETFSGTIEAYQAPEEFGQCDGTESPVPGLYLGQQLRRPFGFAYRTKVGNDTATDSDDGYKIHLIYNATASPSEKQYQTINESPEAITFSWEITTTPIPVEGYKPVSTITIDNRKVSNDLLDDFLDILYGSTEHDSSLLSPEEIIEFFDSAVDVEFVIDDDFGRLKKIIVHKSSPKSVITIPDTVTTIGSYCAQNVHGIYNLVVPDSVISISSEAFYQCPDLTTVSLPDTITSIESGTFWDCPNLTTVNIPFTIKSIPNGFFAGCSSITEFIIPSHVTSIKANAFARSGLKSIDIPENVTEIGTQAFESCKSLQYAIIRRPINEINMSLFRFCSKLEYVVLPSSITKINGYVFSGCTSLTDIYFGGTEEQWNQIKAVDNIPSGVTIHYNSTGPTN